MQDSRQNQKPNRLIHEKSPYLKDHSHNPVDWYPWSEEAFDQAKKLDRVVFLSIGYASCHWCHVMAHESFEDPQIAQLLNENFICIKVDREERPDIDSLYMKALQATGSPGGWPMSMFLTPNRIPITGGTYFPPVEKHGLPSFRAALEMVQDIWKKDRARVQQSSESLLHVLKSVSEKSEDHPLQVIASVAKENFKQKLLHTYDGRFGGFLGNGQNKFPPSMSLSTLLKMIHKDPDPQALEMIERTVDHMLRGGIYDQLGGGLSRYSTDQEWMVPHFEKMLYDNALFAELLAELFAFTENHRYKQAALDVFHYARTELVSEEGGFYCAQDADSGEGEGAFYVWEYSEIERELNSIHDQSITSSILAFWGVTREGNFEGKNILRVLSPLEDFCKQHNIQVEVFENAIMVARDHLVAVRNRREKVATDHKIIASWNGLMISALAKSARLLQEDSLYHSAKKAAEFILANFQEEDGRLYRRYCDGEVAIDALLTDYANTGNAFLELYQTDFDHSWVGHAQRMAHIILERFSAPQGAFYDTKQTDELPVRPVDMVDGVEPSGNSAAGLLLARLSTLGIQTKQYTETLSAMFRRFTTILENHGNLLPVLLRALLLRSSSPSEIAVVVGDNPEEKDRFVDWIRKNGDPLIALCHERDLVQAARWIPLLEHRTALNGKTTFYHCKNWTCLRPVQTLEEYQKLIQEQ